MADKPIKIDMIKELAEDSVETQEAITRIISQETTASTQEKPVRALFAKILWLPPKTQ